MKLDLKQNPKCIGFIMDGNRRFAKENNLPSELGHAAGKEKLFDVIKWIEAAAIPHAVFYAFSTENWKRSIEEVEKLMALFEQALDYFLGDLDKDKIIAVRIVGRKKDFSAKLQEKMRRLEEKSGQQPKLTVWIALSYGGRAEIVDAANEAIKQGISVTEESFNKLLWTAEMPDPDLVVRTGGDRRLSNFLPWQSVYSELFFTDTLWPAFTKDEFTGILNDYVTRERRIGK